MKTNEHPGAKQHFYNTCDPQYLRESRATAGVDIVVLARNACLSVAQVRQLEAGGGSLFYSEAIKRQAYKRLLMIMGDEPPTADVSDELGDAGSTAEAPSKTLTQKTSGQISIDRLSSSSVRAGRTQFKRLSQVFAVLSLLALVSVLYFLYSPKDSEQTVSDVQAPAPMQQQAVMPPATMEKPSSSAVTTASPSAVNQAESCAYSSEPMSELTSFIAKKEGRYVYLVALENVEICVVDGSKQATLVQLKAQEDRSVHGVSPWQIAGSDLQKVHIYFQGGRVSLPNAQVNRVQLVEVPVVR